MADVFTYPYAREPPPSPFLGGIPGGPRSYEHIQTGVRADIAEGWLRTPVPRAAFHAEELATALALDDDFRREFAHAGQAARRPDAPLLDPALGLAWWRFTTARDDLRRGWPAADIVVPDLLLFARRDGGRSTTVLVWPDAIRALVIPAAAEHIVVKTDPGRASVPPAFLPRATVLAKLRDRSLSFATPVPHDLYRGGPAHHEVMADLRAAAVGAEPAKAFRPVRPTEVEDAPTRGLSRPSA
jgi:hypothetical protein